MNHTQAWRVAVHESGHVLLANQLPSFVDVVSTELLWSASDQAWCGFTLATYRLDSPTHEWDHLVMAMAGMAAELSTFADVIDGASEDDLRAASKLAKRWFRPDAKATPPLPAVVGSLDDELKTWFLMRSATNAAIKVISDNRERHERLSLELLDLERLNETQINHLLR